MTEDGTGQEIDYVAKCKELQAQNDALTKSLNEYLDSNLKLKAEMNVLQQINRKTLGVSGVSDNPVPSSKLSLSEAIDKYKKSIKV